MFRPTPGREPVPVPLLGQQRKPTEEEQKAHMEAGLMQTVQQLSLKIYVQLAVHRSWPLDGDEAIPELQQLARDSLLAAQAYFEGLGVAQFTPKPPQPAQE